MMSSRLRVIAGLGEKLHGYETMEDFVQSLEKPRYAQEQAPVYIFICKHATLLPRLDDSLSALMPRACSNADAVLQAGDHARDGRKARGRNH